MRRLYEDRISITVSMFYPSPDAALDLSQARPVALFRNLPRVYLRNRVAFEDSAHAVSFAARARCRSYWVSRRSRISMARVKWICRSSPVACRPNS